MQKPRYKFTLILILLLGLTANANPVALTLEQCIDSAVCSNAALNAAALEMERAGILKGTAFDPPFTSILLKQETTGGGGPDNGVAFTQDFEFPTVYTSRYRRLDALYRLEQSKFALELAKTGAEIASAYHSALYTGELIRLNKEIGEIYDGFLKLANIRLQEGESGRLEVMNAERVVEKNRLECLSLMEDLSAGLANLKNMIGINADVVPADSAQYLVEYIAPEDFLFEETLRGNIAYGESRVAEKEINEAKNGFLPGITLGATVQALIKGFNPYHIERNRFEPGNFMAFEVGISVPLFFGAQNSRLKAAKAERNAVLLRNEYASSQAENEVAALKTKLKSTQARLEYLNSAGIPRADEIKRIAEVSYELGEINYLEYLANIETAYSVYKDLADTIQEYNQTAIRLKELTTTR